MHGQNKFALQTAVQTVIQTAVASLWIGLCLVTPAAQGQLSNDSAQLKAALSRFPAADDNGDGRLTMEEVKTFLSSNQSRLLKRYPDADRNSDGTLSLDEVAAFLQRNRKKSSNKSNGQANAATAPKGGNKFVYKTVGKADLPIYVFGNEKGSKKPAIVFFFGGGWKNGSPKQFEEQCKYLAARGMVAATVEYRVSSRFDVKIEDCIEDAKSAMRWVRSHAVELGIDPDRIASGGGSAGGHLAACTALLDEFNSPTDSADVSCKPNAMVLFNPALAIAPDSRMTEQERKRASEVSSRSRTAMKNVSPLTYASSRQPPMIMFFGTDDSLLKGANFFMQDSEEAGNQCELVTYQGQGHGFFNRDKYQKLTMQEMDQFLVKLDWLEAR